MGNDSYALVYSVAGFRFWNWFKFNAQEMVIFSHFASRIVFNVNSLDVFWAGIDVFWVEIFNFCVIKKSQEHCDFLGYFDLLLEHFFFCPTPKNVGIA